MNLPIHIDTKNTSYIIDVLETGDLENLYYGSKISHMKDYLPLKPKNHVPYGDSVYKASEYRNIGLDDQCLEYSGTGTGDFREPAVDITFEDGSTTTKFIYKNHKQYKGRKQIPNLPCALGNEEQCETFEVNLWDEEKKVELTLFYVIYKECDVITRFTKIKNKRAESITINRLMSTQLDLYNSNYDFVTFDGCWANERHMNTKNLMPGIYVSDSKTGSSSSRHNPFVILKEHNTDEDYGNCYGFNLVYSGCHSEICEVTNKKKTRFLSGINPYSFSWELKPEEEFYTPEAVMTFSKEGLSGMSRNMHAFVRDYIVRGQWQYKERPVLINNWEATGFKFNKSKLLSLAKSASSLGIELFVLDDGWFGKRDSDESSLGDWTVNEKKLGCSLEELSKKINDMGMMFGIWVEPEMISEDSDLYRKHPDWAIKTPERKPCLGRNQHVLDLTKKEVREYIIEAMTKVFSSGNISYVKWDMNRNISDPYSYTLHKKNQGEFYHRFILGLYEIMNKLVQRFPKILFEGCASGGDRFDLGILCYMPQIWTSDNTDPITRLSIQGGTSYGYPQSTMGAHVSASPNVQTLRNTPIETRFNVAAYGLLGYELDLTMISKFDTEVIKKQIDFYKKHRRLFQFGQFYRNKGEMDGEKIVWTVIDEKKEKAITTIFQGAIKAIEPFDILKVRQVEENINYKVQSRVQYINVKTLGSLVNYALPIKLKSDGIAHAVLASRYMLEVAKECYEVPGDLLKEYGIKTLQQFTGTGYNDNIRILGDYGSSMYIICSISKEKHL